MALFRRRKTNAGVLPEIEEYYEAEKRDRTAVAWLMAIVSIVCVVALIIGLFFGGRFVYDRLTDDSTDSTEITERGTSIDTAEPAASSRPGSSAVTTTYTPNNSSPVATSASTSTASSTASTTTTTQTSVKLTNTGPESVIPVFIVTVILSILFYRFKILRASV